MVLCNLAFGGEPFLFAFAQPNPGLRDKNMRKVAPRGDKNTELSFVGTKYLRFFASLFRGMFVVGAGKKLSAAGRLPRDGGEVTSF